MTVKSIIDVEVNDGAFARFKSAFDEYNKAVQKMPAAWAKMAKEQNGGAAIFSRKGSDKDIKSHEKIRDAARTTASAWRDVARSTKDVASNIATATRHLITWAGITGAVTGLLGGGGLWGMDRMAASIASGRRSSMGMGTSQGGREAFALNYNRVVDPDSFLSSVAGAIADPAKRTAFSTLGMSEGDMSGDTASVAVRVLSKMKDFVDRTPKNNLGSLWHANHLDDLAPESSARVLQGMSPGELSDQGRHFGKDVSDLNLTPNQLRLWNDFNTQMERAGKTINKTFVVGISPLAGPLSHLSDVFCQAVTKLLEVKGPLDSLIPVIAKGITEFADVFSKSIADGSFQKNVESFIADFEKIARFVGSAFGWISSDDDRTKQISDALTDPSKPLSSNPPKMDFADAVQYAVAGKRPINNPSNLREPGPNTKNFMQYPTLEAGIRAAARQLQIDQDVHHLNTIRDIITKEEPSNENDTQGYIKSMSSITGYMPDMTINTHDLEQLARLVQGRTIIEGNRIPPEVIVKVLNTPGGNPIVSASQAGQ